MVSKDWQVIKDLSTTAGGGGAGNQQVPDAYGLPADIRNAGRNGACAEADIMTKAFNTGVDLKGTP